MEKWVFTLTLFLSSSLLFVVQPMFARMALPLLGGAPGVWNLCMVFFQAVLLAGYAYAHLTSRWLPIRSQIAVHLGLMVVPLALLPMGIPEGWSAPRGEDPTLWLLALLAVVVGLPFLAVSTMGPLMQKWFAGTGHAQSDDPYFLYAASNLGSMLALLAYPIAIEPGLVLASQSRAWAGGYALLIAMTAGCGALLWRSGGAVEREVVAAAPLPWSRRLRWTALAFVPSSLMLGMTTYVTSDLASVPLLWIAPLALYLLSFILVFAQKPPIPHRWMVLAMPTLLILLSLMVLGDAKDPLLLVVVVHFAAFFVATMVCHGELAADRPETAHLTEFYLILSVGGVLGGLFNSLVAPVVFDSAAEYPIALICAAFLLPARTPEGSLQKDVLAAAVVGVVAVVAALVGRAVVMPNSAVETVLTIGLPVGLCMVLIERPVRFGLGLAAVFGASVLNPTHQGTLLFAERSFFGIHRVVRWDNSSENALLHGTTVHGLQPVDEQGRPIHPEVPSTYFHRTGPAGQVLGAVLEPSTKLGLVGFGTGSLMAYGLPGQRVTAYEIDPVVAWIATESPYYSYAPAAVARGVDFELVVADARLALADTEERYDLLVLDAFSSDAIPLHLLSLEAFRDVYLPHLEPHGFLLVHVSSRHLELAPVVARMAETLDLVVYRQFDIEVTEEQDQEGKYISDWLLVGRGLSDLEPMVSDPRWAPVEPTPGRVWTDDYSNIVSVVRALHGG